MNKFFTHLLVTLFTFVIGLIMTSAFLFFTQSPQVKSTATANLKIENLFADEIQYHVIENSLKPNIGMFKVSVSSNESNFVEYDKNGNVRNWRNEDNSLQRSCCPYGLDLQKLEPNKPVKFKTFSSSK